MRQMMQRMLPPKVIPHALYGPRSRAMVRSMIGGAFKVGALQRFTDHMFGIILILGKPKSRGTLRLQSTDVSKQALIDPAYYSHPEDMETMIKGVRIAREIGASKGLGYLMFLANGRAKVDLMFAALVLLAVFTVALHAAVSRFGRSLEVYAQGRTGTEREQT